MIITEELAGTAEAVSKILGSEVECQDGTYQLKTKRSVYVKNSKVLDVSLSLDLDISFSLSDEGPDGSNEARVCLMPEELAAFTQALIAHPLYFPISYSQHMTMECGMYCIRLTSQEPPEVFAERLVAALEALG